MLSRVIYVNIGNFKLLNSEETPRLCMKEQGLKPRQKRDTKPKTGGRGKQ